MFQKLSRDKEDIKKKTQIELLEMKTTTFKMKKKNTLDEINIGLNSVEGKM